MFQIPDSQNINQLFTSCVSDALYGKPTASEAKSIALGKKPMMLDPQDGYMAFNGNGGQKDLSLLGEALVFAPAAEEEGELNGEDFREKDRNDNDNDNPGTENKKKNVLLEKVSFGDGHKKLFVNRKAGIAIFDEI